MKKDERTESREGEAAASSVELEVVAGPLRGKRFVFTEHDTLIFGRAPECHARLPANDLTVSRHHFLLEVNPPDARLRDLGSANGTHVNGVEYRGRDEGQDGESDADFQQEGVDLRDGDRITVGETLISVHIRVPFICLQCGAVTADAAPELSTVDPAFCVNCSTASFGETEIISALCCDCGKDVSIERGRRRGSAFLCAACREAATTDPIGLMSRVTDLSSTSSDTKSFADALSGYRVIGKLGQGAMGVVYLAERTHDSSPVAIKVMLAKTAVDEVSRRHFHREIEVTREIHHHNVVTLFDHGSAGPGFYFVMEYCSLGSVADLLKTKGGMLELDEARPIMLQALDGLSFVHERGIVHRDLKPHNILLTGIGDPVVKIADLGLAKECASAGLSGMTVTGVTGGTFWYMPREQLTGYKYVEPISDVWSMAATFYTMMTGAYPRTFPPGCSPVSIILRDAAVPIRTRRKAIPENVARVIDRALEDELDSRYRTAMEFREELAAALTS